MEARLFSLLLGVAFLILGFVFWRIARKLYRDARGELGWSTFLSLLYYLFAVVYMLISLAFVTAA